MHPFTKPLIPQQFLPAAAAIVAIAAGLLPVFAVGTLPFHICMVVIGVGGAFGIVSNGVKKKADG